MQVIATAPTAARANRLALARVAVSAVLMIVAGGMLAWLCVTTPIISAFVPNGRPSAMQAAAGILAWGFAIVVPAGFLILGLARILTAVEAAAALRSTAMAPRLARSLGADHLAATDLILPGGRRIHELVLGPFGIVVLGDVPPAGVSRHVGNHWELRGPRGRWLPIEAPLDRAARDAERVRGWLTTDDRDFLVRVYAAIVTDDRQVERTPTCAVVRPGDLGAWLQALPTQRGLTSDRRERLVELIRSVATGR
jgi:hypothetical protein